MTCVKWCGTWSGWFNLICGIDKEAFYLHVCLMYMYFTKLYSLVKKMQSCGCGCYVRNVCVNILLYADDIVLMAPSTSSLQQLMYECDKELQCLDIDMSINVKKSVCMHIGARYSINCSRVSAHNGGEIIWSTI